MGGRAGEKLKMILLLPWGRAGDYSTRGPVRLGPGPPVSLPSAPVAVQVGAKRQTRDVAVDPGLFYPVPALAQIFFPVAIESVVEHFGLDRQGLDTLGVIRQ